MVKGARWRELHTEAVPAQRHCLEHACVRATLLYTPGHMLEFKLELWRLELELRDAGGRSRDGFSISSDHSWRLVLLRFLDGYLKHKIR